MRNFDFKRYTPGPKKLLRASLSVVSVASVTWVFRRFGRFFVARKLGHLISGDYLYKRY